MDSARLIHPIEILGLTTVTTQYGNNKSSYTPKYNTKAHIIFNSESMVTSEGEILYPTNRTFVVRAYVPVIETDRIRWDNKEWKILTINKNQYYNDIEIITTLVNK